ncbi:protein lethal(2)essential for life-like [Penaeus chinensis]|uniref:protein lethal(2)essential for life-like n=1 Tax=Penaeus chinensis TaxID=139456 RepID=UPI001FB60AE0|nr:protein lethal(2)essential for life-like [Penaeus chinensis]
MSPTSDDDDDEGYTFIVRQPGNSYRVTFGDEESHAWKRDSSACDPRSNYSFKSSGFDCVNRNLPIVRKGLFADDCCFENVRHSYSQAVKEVLEKANGWSCRSDAMDNYRKLRQQKLNLENQAVGVSEDSESHKIVIDVFDFISGDVTVRLVEGKELLVEGQAEKQDGSRVSRVSFVRRFALPDLVDRDAISCVLSSDGILTIISKKKGKAQGQE